MLSLLVFTIFFSAVFGQSMMPQCRCNQLTSCLQQEQQKMLTCAMSTQCITALGGNRNQVSTCITQKWQGVQPLELCMKMKMANMGCTNSTNPMQVRSQPMMNAMNQQMPVDNSAPGRFMTCLHNCMMGSGSQMNSGCPQQLGCALDFSMLDLEMVVMAAESCNLMSTMDMMKQPNSNTMSMSQGNMNMNMNQQQQQQSGSMMQQQSSGPALGMLPKDCMCLMNAGVQITCNYNMMMNGNNMMMSNNNMNMNNMNINNQNNRGRRWIFQ